MPDFLWPQKQQHARLPCPSLPPGVCLNSRPLSWWCHPTVSSSVTPFYSCLQSFPASEPFPMSWQVYILESVAIFFFRGSSWPRDQTWGSFITGRFFTIWATREAHKPTYKIYNLDLGLHIVSKRLPLYSVLTMNLSQWSLSSMEYSFWTVIHQILFPLCKLPYNKPTHWFYGADCIIFWSQDAFWFGEHLSFPQSSNREPQE